MLTRLFVLIDKTLKAAYQKHAEENHGMTLSGWIRHLMRQDFKKHTKPRD